MKVLLTGSSGRIGRALHARLALEHEVIGLDRVPAPTTQVVADLGDAQALRRALRGVVAVVHSAALHAPQVGRFADSEFQRINVDASLQLARLAAEAGTTRLVFTSTTALYGAAALANGAAAWIDEQTQPAPQSIYHLSKLAAEAALAQQARQSGMVLTLLRMSRCFPEPAPLMAAYRLHRGIDARDVAEAHVLALQWAQPGCRLFVISGSTPFQRNDAAALLRDAPAVLRQRAPAIVQAFDQRGWPLPPSIDRVYDPALAMQMLGWQPRHGFESVLLQADAGSAEVLPAAHEGCPC